MKTLRIAIIDPVGRKAGMDYYDLSLALALNKQSCRVNVYSNFAASKNESFVKNHFNFSLKYGLFNSFYLLKKYLSALIKSRSDKTEIVIIHLFHSSFLDYFLISIIHLFGFRICLIIHDVESLLEQSRKSWIQKCCHLPSYLVVHNIVSFDELLKKIPLTEKEKVFIIPHGNYIGLNEITSKKETSKYFNLDSNIVYLLFFGMIKKSKGLDILIEALKDVPSNVHLIIAGRTRNISFNHYEKMIKKLNLSERVHPLIRYITNDERNKLFNFSDLAILPYQNIYQSGVLLMAMSYGLPAIVSDLTSNKLIINEKNGILFKTGDVSDLVTKINEIICDEKKRKYIAENAKEYVKINNDWEKIGADYLKMFLTTLDVK